MKKEISLKNKDSFNRAARILTRAKGLALTFYNIEEVKKAMLEDIEILMADGKTESDAISLLVYGTTIYDDFEENGGIEEYIDEWYYDDDLAENLREMVKSGVPAPDWGVVDLDGKRYFIEYCY